MQLLQQVQKTPLANRLEHLLVCSITLICYYQLKKIGAGDLLKQQREKKKGKPEGMCKECT